MGWRRGRGRGGAFLLVSPLLGPPPLVPRGERMESGGPASGLIPAGFPAGKTLASAKATMKILVISLAGIGDAFLATPLIHELRLSFPAATIDALVRWAGARDLLESNPHLNR